MGLIGRIAAKNKLRRDRARRTDLIRQAVARSDVEEVSRLLDEDPMVANTTHDGLPLICMAAACRGAKSPEILELLVAHGANPNAPDSSGMHPLHFAATGLPDNVRALAKVNAKIDAPTDNTYKLTPLHVAAMQGRAEAVQDLLDLGANPSKRSGDGSTALIYAKTSGHARVIAILQQRLGQTLTTVVNVTIRSKNIGLSYPDKCVYCCADPDTYVKVTTKPGSCKLKTEVPYCNKHHARIAGIGLSANAADYLWFLLAAIPGMIVAALLGYKWNLIRFGEGVDPMDMLMMAASVLVAGFISAIVVIVVVGYFLHKPHDRTEAPPEREDHLNGGTPIATSCYSHRVGSLGWLITIDCDETSSSQPTITATCEFTNADYAHLFAKANNGRIAQ